MVFQRSVRLLAPTQRQAVICSQRPARFAGAGQRLASQKGAHFRFVERGGAQGLFRACLLYTSDAADD